MRTDHSLHIFVATPRDVAAERDRLGLIVRDLNNVFAAHGLTLKLLDWRDVVPDLGRPEDVILDQLPVEKWDIFIGVLWARFGTPPGRKDPETGKPFLSGTEEEFTLACRSWRETDKPRILFYRCRRPVPVDRLDPEQFTLVLKFFDGFKAGDEYPGLYQEYETVDDFERRVRQDLLKLLLEYGRGEKQAAFESEVGAEVHKLEEEQRVREEVEAKEQAKEEAQAPLFPSTPQLRLPPDPDTLYTEALELFHLGQYAEAIPVFKAVLKAQPDYPGAEEKLEAARLRAELPSLRESDRWREVLEVVARIRELEPDYNDAEGYAAWAEEHRKVRVLYSQGLKAMEAKKWPEAARVFQEILGIDPGYRQAQAFVEQARTEYRRLIAKWRELRCLRGHSATVNSVAFSPADPLLAFGSGDGTVCLCDARTGQGGRILKEHKDGVNSVAFSPDGSLLASGSKDGTVCLWNAHAGQKVYLLKGHRGEVNSVAFSPDGSLLASGSSDTTVQLWYVREGRQARLLQKGWTVYSVAFSQDGEIAASCSGSPHLRYDNAVELWDALTGWHVRLLQKPELLFISAAFSPAGPLIACGSEDGTVSLWNVRTGQEEHLLKGHKDSVNSVAFSLDGSLLASGSTDSTVQLWEVATGEQVCILKGHTGAVSSIAFSSDGLLLASASMDGTVRLWGAK